MAYQASDDVQTTMVGGDPADPNSPAGIKRRLFAVWSKFYGGGPQASDNVGDDSLPGAAADGNSNGGSPQPKPASPDLAEPKPASQPIALERVGHVPRSQQQFGAGDDTRSVLPTYARPAGYGPDQAPPAEDSGIGSTDVPKMFSFLKTGSVEPVTATPSNPDEDANDIASGAASEGSEVPTLAPQGSGNRLIRGLQSLFDMVGKQPAPGEKYVPNNSEAHQVAENILGRLGNAAENIGYPETDPRRLAIEREDLALRRKEIENEAAWRDAMLGVQNRRVDVQQQGNELRYGPHSPQMIRSQIEGLKNGVFVDPNTSEQRPLTAEEIAANPVISQMLRGKQSLADYQQARAEFERAQTPIALARLQQAEQRLKIDAQNAVTNQERAGAYAQSVNNTQQRYFVGMSAQNLRARLQANAQERRALIQAQKNPNLIPEILHTSMSLGDIQDRLDELETEDNQLYAQLGRLTPHVGQGRGTSGSSPAPSSGGRGNPFRH